ncbi:sphingomyelin phosphodiesterase [Entomortierella parvispora]|uniref:Sphingomyelin phosphodiesterase n=1 Tax=Entomortierella parvispora TaxID=205924 RepID=A0A9P3M2C7_9FUNG|nr:sphingomyelin phosphodiesterase [Entomortierella parvispora]
MRISLPSVILSLAVASSVYAAPVTPKPVHQLAKRGWVLDKIESLLEDLLNTLECDACEAALVGIKDVAYLNKDWVLDAINDLCPTLAKEPAAVCSGLVYSQGPVLLDSLLSADLTGGDGQEICFQVMGICPAPAVSSGTLTFPKPRPANPVAPPPSGNQIEVLHLSDWHVDAQYTPGSEANCDYPLCCRNYAGQTTPVNRSAASWGDYNCDAPVKLGQNMLQYLPTVATPAFSILTGDVPPHDVWLESSSTVPGEISAAYDIMAAVGTIYPTVGNHEGGPPNLFPTTASGGDLSWLYDDLASDWAKWLPADATSTVKNYGAYTVSPVPGFRIISLNTQFCYTMNFYLYADTSDYDPNGEINWLITQLQAAEDAGERVWIIGHVGPSQTDCLQNWSALYYQVVQRYSPHVIAEQFFGHTHYDEFALYYGPGAQSSQNALATAWIGPSVTPYTDLNPGFRIYKVDNGSWNVFESETYTADLSQAATWDATGATPNWHLEYSARQAYGAYVPIADNAPLSAAWWHNVTLAFESTAAAFTDYWTYRGKSSGLIGACAAGSACSTEMICDLRAGESSQSCSKITLAGALKKREDGTEYLQDDSALNPTTSGPVYKRANDKPWNKKLCGTY